VRFILLRQALPNFLISAQSCMMLSRLRSVKRPLITWRKPLLWVPIDRAFISLIHSHAKGRRVDVHVPVLHHLPHLLVQLSIAAHALHHLA
jgi:hypothetical protein